MIDQFFSFCDHLVEHLQLMTVGQLEITIDANRVDISISLAQPPLDLARGTDRYGALAAMVPFSHE